MEAPGPVGAADDDAPETEMTPQETSPETTPTASTASLGALPFLEADEPAPAPHPDPATAHEFLELVACGVAAYGARCEIAHRVSHGDWVAGFVRRAAAAVGATATAATARVATAEHADDEREEDEFVVLRTPEREIASRGAALGEDRGARCVAAVAAAEIAARRYDARGRAVLKELAGACGVSWSRRVVPAEAEAARGARVAGDVAEPGAPRRKKAVKLSVAAQVSLTAVGGGALLALSGVVAAPSLAASLLGGATALGATTAATEGAAAAVAGCITGVFGALGAGMSGLKARRRFVSHADWELMPLGGRPEPRVLAVAAPDDDEDDEDELDYAGAADLVSLDGSDGAAADETLLDVSLERSAASEPRGVPRFFLVPGWVADGHDARGAFGSGGCVRAVAPLRGDEAARELSDSWDEMRPDALPEKPKRVAAPPLIGNLSGLNEPLAEGATIFEADAEPPPPGDDARARAAPLRLEACDWWAETFPHTSYERVVLWERAALRRLHDQMADASLWVEAKERVARGVVDEMLRRSALGAATLPLALLERFAKLDDPWAVAIARSEAAGRRLADLLMGPGDDGPATLVGYGAGARLVLHCLEALAEIADDASRPLAVRDRAASRVENAVLLGAPVSATPARWRKARAAVAGRLINGFSRHDFMLKLVYRAKAWSIAGIAGERPVRSPERATRGDDDPIVENVDLSDLVAGHLAYPHVMHQILVRLGLED